MATNTKELKDSMNKYLPHFFSLAKMIYVIYDYPRGIMRLCNPSFSNLLGSSPQELIGCNYIEIVEKYVHPSDWSSTLSTYESLSNKLEIPYFCNRYRSQSGSYIWIEWSLTYSPEQQMVFFTGKDITKKRQFKQDLRQSQDRFAKVFELSPAMMSIMDIEDQRFISVNKAFTKILGYSKEEIVGKTLSELKMINCETSSEVRRRALAGEKILQENCQYRSKSGEMIEGLFSSEIIKFNGKLCLLAVAMDITDQLSYQEELARLDRLNMIGQLAASIGHEVRNPLQTVRGFLQLYSRREQFKNELSTFELMISELDRANDIITNFLSLSKPTQQELSLEHLNQVVLDMAPLLESDALREDKNLEISLKDLPLIKLDKQEIRQLILNLYRNGLESMEKQGTIRISTFLEEDWAVLEVVDQGAGIKEEVLLKLGTPFFTTKDQGTGLGFTICQRIIERHGGKIQVDSSSQGTKIRASFPLI